jgi:hypothetical protein
MTTLSGARILCLASLVLGTQALTAETGSIIRVVSFQRAPSPYVVIPVPIKGRGCASLVFDTGTNLSILGPDLAARLPFVAGGAMTIASASGRTTAQMAAVSGIGFELTGNDAPIPVVMTEVSALRELVGNVNGIFGQSLLRQSDYYLDYGSRRLTLGSAGTLNPAVSGARLPLEWSEGRPAIQVPVRTASGAALSIRLVLDSGIDRVTLFGGVARQIAAVQAATTLVRVQGPLGVTLATAAPVVVSAGDRDKTVTATLMAEVLDRHEDGLLPTSLFRSVFVSAAEGIVVLDGALRVPGAERTAGVNCSSR